MNGLTWVLAPAAAGVLVRAAVLVRPSLRCGSLVERHRIEAWTVRVGHGTVPGSRRRRGGEGIGPPKRAVVVCASGLASLLLLGPAVTAGLTAVWLTVRAASSRRATRRERADRDRAVPELVDLFVLAAAAGLPVASALPVVAERAPGPLRPALATATGRLALGAPLADALHLARADLGPRAAPLLDVLDAAARTGSPLVPALHQVAATARDERTRAAEEAARRLPVSLLFPLACCVLPAAVLLALVPVIVSSLSSLGR